jgi:hypothetical protein
MEKIESILDEILLSHRLCFEIAKMLLATVFIQYDNSSNQEKAIRKYLIDDFYQILHKKQNEYFIELKDYSKNNEYHTQVQVKIKNIILIANDLNKKDFHDNIIYFMNILS